MKKVSKEDLKKMIDRNEEFKLVDVRGKECCYDKGHIPRAVSIPLNELEERAPKDLKKDEPVIVYCGSYSCTLSPRAAHMLEEHMGYTDLAEYSGGIKEWRDSGYPVETS